MKLRYDPSEDDGVLNVEIVRADAEGCPISPPLLHLEDEMTGDTITLTREQAWKLRDLINRM